jgi:hypothetical protein
MGAEDYPVWVWHKAQPFQFELCTDRASWFKYRRQGWRTLRVDVVAARLNLYIESMGISVADAIEMCRAFQIPLADLEISLLFSGGGPNKLYSLDVLEWVARVFAFPVTYLYVTAASSPPNIFKERFVVTSRAVFRPPSKSRDMLWPTKDGEPITNHAVDDLVAETPALRVFHILYTLTDSAVYHRAHAVAQSKDHAEAFFLQANPLAEIKEVSHQPVEAGLLIYNY